MTQAIRLDVIDNLTQHFCVYFDRPGRIEVSLIADPLTDQLTSIIAHVYDGTKDDLEQDLLGVYDGTIGDNESWSA